MAIIKFRTPGKAISEKQLAALETKLEYVLPNDYRAYLLESNGGEQPDREIFSIEDGTESLLKDLFSIDDRIIDLSGKLLFPDDRLPPDLVPVGMDGCGNYLCLGVKGGRRGEIYFHDRGKIEPDDEFEPVYFVARNFTEFIASLKAVQKPTKDEIEHLGESGTIADLLGYIAAGNSLEKTSKYKFNILQEAARYGNLELVRKCHEHGLSFAGALRLAVMNSQLEVVRYLLSMGVDVNERNAEGKTALSYCWKQPEIEALLLKHGATK